MKRRSVWLPILLFIMGGAFYLYYGTTHNAWIDNLPNIIIYIIILLALHLALRKKEQLQKQREDNN